MDVLQAIHGESIGLNNIHEGWDHLELLHALPNPHNKNFYACNSKWEDLIDQDIIDDLKS